MCRKEGVGLSGKQVLVRLAQAHYDYVEEMVERIGGGYTRNAAVNLIIASYRERDELDRLRDEVKKLREKCVNLAMGRE